jgi:hypothetical protein
MGGATVEVREGANGTYAVLVGGKPEPVHTTNGLGAHERAQGFAAWLRLQTGEEPRGRCCFGEACDRDRLPSQCLAFAAPEALARVKLCARHGRIATAPSSLAAELAAFKARGPGAPPGNDTGPAPRGRTRRGKQGALS